LASGRLEAKFSCLGLGTYGLGLSIGLEGPGLGLDLGLGLESCIDNF